MMKRFNKKILLTEQIKEFSRDISMLLTKNGFQVIYSDSEELTKSILNSTEIDLVITKFDNSEYILEILKNSTPFMFLAYETEFTQINNKIESLTQKDNWHEQNVIVNLPLSFENIIEKISDIFSIGLSNQLELVKKKCALLTISNNESFFLPIWIKHYKRFFDLQDIYILNHQTDDGSLNDLGVNIINIENEYIFDREWMVSKIEQYQEHLLKSYKCVVFSNVDELVYAYTPLNKIIEMFIEDGDVDVMTGRGWEIVQDLKKETPLLPTDNILFKRNYWIRNYSYDKTPIIKKPIKYEKDMSILKDYPRQFKYDIMILHLRRCDFEILWNKKNHRLKKFKPFKDESNKFQNTQDKLEFFEYFNSELPNLMLIPDDDKMALNWI